LQKIEKEGGKFVRRDGLEGRNPQEEEEMGKRLILVLIVIES